MRHKDDYTCIAFYDTEKPKKWQYVHKLKGFADFLNSKHPGWKYFNVYDRRKGDFLKRFYPNSLVPEFLLCFLIFLGLNNTLKSTFDKATFGSPTFIYGFNNTATIPTPLNEKGGVE